MSWWMNGTNRQNLIVDNYPEHSGQFSTSAWVRWGATEWADQTNQRDWFTKGWVGNPNRRWAVGRQGQTCYFHANLAGTFRQLSTGAVFAQDIWYHVVTRKTASHMEIWINGVLIASFADGNGTNDGPHPFSLGNGDDNSHYAYGFQAEQATWTESIPTGVIEALSNGSAPNVWKNSLRGYWPLLNIWSIPAGTAGHVDLSGNGFHAHTQVGASTMFGSDLHPPMRGLRN